MDVGDRAARIDADFVSKGSPQSFERGERLCLPAGAAQRQHVLSPDRLVKGIGDDERFQTLQRRGDSAERELGIDQVLGRRKAELLQASGFRDHKGLLGKLGENRATPQGERYFEVLDGPFVIRIEETPATLAQAMFERAGVDRSGISSEAVPMAIGKDHRPPCRVSRSLDEGAEARDIVLQHPVGGRWGVAPHEIDQSG